MKGIRKLFLGLFLVALISVGLKVETQAAITGISYDVSVPANIDYTATGTTNPVKGILSVTYDDITDIMPDYDTEFVTYKIQLQSQDGTPVDGATKYLCLKNDNYELYKRESTVSPTDAETGTFTKYEDPSQLTCEVSALRSKIVEAVDSGSSPFTLKLHVTLEASSTGTSPDLAGATSDANAKTLTRKVSPSIVLDSDPTNPTTITGITLSPNTDVYLLPGQTKTFSLSVTEKQYNVKFKNWATSPASVLTETSSTSSVPISVTVKVVTNPTPPTEDAYVRAVYEDGEVTFTWDKTSYKPGDSANPAFSFTGYKYTDIVSGEIYVDSVTASNKLSKYTFNGIEHENRDGHLQFTVPSLSNNPHKLLLKMKDGNVLETSTFTVNDTSSLAWKSTSALTSGVAVTAGMDVYIRQFLSDGQLKKGVVTLESPARDYATMINDSQRVIGSYQVHGDKAMTGDSGKKDRIRITPDTGDGLTGTVTVYPKISIATNSSSSDDSLNSGSSSTTSKDTPIKITSPTYVYYNDKNYQVKKLKLRFAGPKDTVEKTLDAPSTDSTSSLSWSASVDSIKLSKILKEVCDSSSNTITLTVFPYNGDSADDQIHTSTEIKAYKINLDGGGGAKYTVNGEDMGDYFYAVKGTKYTIKAQPKLTGDKFLNWDGSVFSSETGGEFTASESRTFRANYSSSSSSSSSNTNKTALNGDSMSGDYDDVPKTGESRTDIWILWSVLFISILGAGFMIWKRFGLARAIAEADAAVEHAEYEEQVKAAEKEKKEKLDMLKDLRNL